MLRNTEILYAARQAIRNQRQRERIRRQGYVGGKPLWTHADNELFRSLYPDYGALRKAFPLRSYWSLRNHSLVLKIAKKSHVWTAAQVSRLRRSYSTSSRAELLEAFPGLKWSQIAAKVHSLRLQKRKRALKPTGFQVLDAIRARAQEIGYSMGDLDEEAGTKRYFQDANWYGKRSLNASAVFKAIHAMDGDVLAVWR